MAAGDGPAAAVEMAGFYRTLCLNDYNNGASLQSNLGPLSGGANVMLLGTPLMAPGQAQPRETSIYAITNYHGRFDPASAPEAVGGVGVEVRMAHQVLGAAPT